MKILGRVVKIVERSRTWVSAILLSRVVASWLGRVLVEMVGLPLVQFEVQFFFEGATVYLAQWWCNWNDCFLSFSLVNLSRSKGTLSILVGCVTHGLSGLHDLINEGFGGRTGGGGVVKVPTRFSTSTYVQFCAGL